MNSDDNLRIPLSCTQLDCLLKLLVYLE